MQLFYGMNFQGIFLKHGREILVGFTYDDSDARKEFSKALSSKPEAYLKEKFQKTFEGEYSALMKPIVDLLMRCWQKDPAKR